MSLILYHIEDHLSLGIWNVEESDLFFQNQIHIYEEEIKDLKELSPRKKSEWLSSRHLLHVLTAEEKRLICKKDNFGKPYLVGSSDHISLSHSRDYSAAMVCNFPCGVDIQYKVDKLQKIQTKFLSPKELTEIGETYFLEKLHVYWGAKECLFKAYGKGSVDFKTMLYIHPFDISDNIIHGEFIKDQIHLKYELKQLWINNYVLVYTDKLI